jgi:hypothetical protein
MNQIRKVLGIRLRNPQTSIRSIAEVTGCSRLVRLLLELYRETHSDGLQYSQFCLVSTTLLGTWSATLSTNISVYVKTLVASSASSPSYETGLNLEVKF